MDRNKQKYNGAVEILSNIFDLDGGVVRIIVEGIPVPRYLIYEFLDLWGYRWITYKWVRYSSIPVVKIPEWVRMFFLISGAKKRGLL